MLKKDDILEVTKLNEKDFFSAIGGLPVKIKFQEMKVSVLNLIILILVMKLVLMPEEFGRY